MRLKVQGGTARNDEDLCPTCKYSTIVELSDSQTLVRCSQLDLRLTKRVTRCNSYSNKNEPPLFEMMKMAWVVTTDAKKKVGFRPYRELTKAEQGDVSETLDFPSRYED